jgi:hypothetical protein
MNLLSLTIVCLDNIIISVTNISLGYILVFVVISNNFMTMAASMVVPMLHFLKNMQLFVFLLRLEQVPVLFDNWRYQSKALEDFLDWN